MPRVALAISKILTGKANGITLTEAQIDALCAESAAAASEILYLRSGKLFTGIAGPVTVRPIARPSDIDSRTWLGTGGWGWSEGWGSASYYGMGAGPVASHYGVSYLPEVDLGDYPIHEILQVKIDGVVIPSDEYELRDFQRLARLRTSASATPTERWGWPTAQIYDLPDTETGTFSITYTYGTDPGEGGRRAARKLAEMIVLPDFGDTTAFPTRVQSIQRQGITATVASVEDLLRNGQLGIYDVDVWLSTVNPQRATRQSAVWSPDVGRPRRTARPTQTGG